MRAPLRCEPGDVTIALLECSWQSSVEQKVGSVLETAFAELLDWVAAVCQAVVAARDAADLRHVCHNALEPLRHGPGLGRARQEATHIRSHSREEEVNGVCNGVCHGVCEQTRRGKRKMRFWVGYPAGTRLPDSLRPVSRAQRHCDTRLTTLDVIIAFQSRRFCLVRTAALLDKSTTELKVVSFHRHFPSCTFDL